MLERDFPTIELSEDQIAHIAYGLAEVAREFIRRPGELERYEAWRKSGGRITGNESICISCKPFALLRAQLASRGIEQSYLCELMHRGQSYITSRINARLPWNQDEQYFIMDLINWPYEKMYELFPPKGRAPN